MNTTAQHDQLSRTAAIRKLAKTDRPQAITELIAFLQDTFDLTIENLQINDDQYSLNSLNGFFEANSAAFFFKFHQEEGEEDMQGEYYRAEIIADAGLPIDMPVMTSTLPGEQILVYKRHNDKRFSDVLLDLDISPDVKAEARAARAEAVLNKQILEVALRTLHPVSVSQVREEPVHHLFFDRMLDLKSGAVPGGRYKDFYVDQIFSFPGVELHWREFSQAKLVVNGQSMRSTFGEIFEAAAHNLHPENLANAGGFTAHGDAHNANVWFEASGAEPTLSYFDPAFAGEHIPSLLAEAKATFHNTLAHPLWLYNAEDVASIFKTEASYKNGILTLYSNWSLSPIRQKLLEAKVEVFWKPFLAHLFKHDMLPDTWQQTLRSALAMCPALVMNLRANADRHNPASSAIAFSLIALCGSEPEAGTNLVTEFLHRITPSQH